MKELVLDISKYDEGIDLAAWKQKHNLWGVIIKAGGNEGGRYKDRCLDTHYKNAVAAGLHIGYYYYTTTCDTRNAVEDANHFADLIGDRKCDLPCYMDVEDPRQFQLTPRELTNVITYFCDTLINRGFYAGLYTGGSAWLNNMVSFDLLKYADWIAWWRSEWPHEAGDIGMWQQGGIRYSDGNIVFDDLPGYHDCDWCAIDYPSRIGEGFKKADDDSPVEIDQNGGARMGRASDVINAAYSQLGYYAPDDPERGSKYGRWMAEVTGEDWMAGPSVEIWWCCMFVSWCLAQGGVSMDGFPTQNTDLALGNGAKKYAVEKESVTYGDIVIFNWDWNSTTDHIGFATGGFDGNGFTTIEGNVGNAVKEKYRQLGNVAYVLRPPYEGYGVVGNNTPTVNTDPRNNRDGGKLDVDGIGGWNTIIDWQNQLGTPEDGWISGQRECNEENFWGMSNVSIEDGGSQLVEAIQRKVGANVDGDWGPETSRKIQQWLVDNGYSVGSAGVDGYFGHDSVMALQKSLNDGKWK